MEAVKKVRSSSSHSRNTDGKKPFLTPQAKTNARSSTDSVATNDLQGKAENQLQENPTKQSSSEIPAYTPSTSPVSFKQVDEQQALTSEKPLDPATTPVVSTKEETAVEPKVEQPPVVQPTQSIQPTGQPLVKGQSAATTVAPATPASTAKSETPVETTAETDVKKEDVKAEEEQAKGEGEDKDKKPETEAVDGEKPKGEEVDQGPEGVAEDFENPPPVKEVDMKEAQDGAGEPIEADEAANNNLVGLIITSQQFRDQGKEAYDRAKEQTNHRLALEKELKGIEKKVDKSDKDLTTAEKNNQTRETGLNKMDVPMKTSNDREAKVSGGVGTYQSSYNEGKGTAKDLAGETGSLLKGSQEHEDPENSDSGDLTSNYKELSSGSATMSEGIMGGGATANKLANDAKAAKVKNQHSEKQLEAAKKQAQLSKNKLTTEKNHNAKAKKMMLAVEPKLKESKKNEAKLSNEGKSLMTTSFAIENETHSAQYFYYSDMTKVPAREKLLEEEVGAFEQELATTSGNDGLLFAFARMETEETRQAFIQKLNAEQRIILSQQLEGFIANHEGWMAAKQEELLVRVEEKRGKKVDHYNEKRNTALQTPLDRVTQNLHKVDKAGLFWSSLTQSLQGIWKGITSITWADVGNFGLALVNPLETWRTISGAVMGIWNDLSDWGGFSKDPVGMILQKGSSVGVKLLTIAGVVTGILGLLTIAATIGAFFTAGALAPLAAWLASATATMGTVTFWIGIVTGILSVLSGIKNIYDIHTAKTADVLFQNTAALKQDTANTGLSIMGIVGGKATVKGGNGLKNTISKYPKTFGKRAFLNMKNGLIRTLTWAPRTVKALFRKETWTGLYASLKKFMSRNSDEVLENKAPYNPTNGSNKKTSTTGGDHTPDKKTTTPHDKNTDSDLPKTNKVDEEPDLDNLKKHEGEVDDATKKKMKDETDKDIPDGPNKDSKRKALLAAKIIAEANDKVDTPVAALLAELLPLKAFKGVTGFGAKELGGGVYRIVMYGSEFDVDENYTPTLKENKKIFRGDDSYDGEDVGFGLNSTNAESADIQTPWDHVSNKESTQSSRYTSFAEALHIKGGGGAAKFSNSGSILKVETNVLNELEKQGLIKIWTPDKVADLMKNSGIKKVIKEANNVKRQMINNGEVLIEGSIPKGVISLAK